MKWCTRLRRARHLEGDDDQRDDADGDVDVEDPAPGQVVDEHPAQQRADDAGQAEHGAEQADVLAPLARRHDVADDGLRADHQPARAQALDGPERDQLDHRVRQPGQDRPGQEDHDRGLEEHLPAVLVAQLAPQRRRHRRGQQVGGDHPGDVGPALQVAHDRRQRGRHDGLVQRGQQHPEHQRTDDQEDPRRLRPGSALPARPRRGQPRRASGTHRWSVPFRRAQRGVRHVGDRAGRSPRAARRPAPASAVVSWSSGTSPPEAAQKLNVDAHHGGGRPGQHAGIGVAVGVGAQPLGQRLGHRRSLGWPCARRGPRRRCGSACAGPHPLQPAGRVAAQVREFLGPAAGLGRPGPGPAR